MKQRVADIYRYPLGIVLTLTDKDGIAPNKTICRILDNIIKITRRLDHGRQE